MSKLTALIATLVLGSSTVAIAQPSITTYRSDRSWVDRDRDFDRDRFGDREVRRYRFDDRFDRDRRREFARDDFGPRRYRSAWVALSSPLQLTGGRDVIDVRDRGTFTQLRIQTSNGASLLDRVLIRFSDGSRQIVDLDQALSPRNPRMEILIDGNNRRIDSIQLLGNSRRNAAVQVFGI